MPEQPIEISLVKIELLSKTLLHCVTPNSNTNWDCQCSRCKIVPSVASDDKLSILGDNYHLVI